MAATDRTHPAQSVARDRPTVGRGRGMPVARDQADPDAYLAPHRPPARPARRPLYGEARYRPVGRSDRRGPLRGPGRPDAGCPDPLARSADECGPPFPTLDHLRTNV